MTESKTTVNVDKQYGLSKIVSIWALSAIPMAVLAFVITPAIASITKWNVLIIYWVAINVGLVWQFFLSLIVLRLDGHEISRQTIITRMRYQKPINPKTGRSNYLLFLWAVPFVLLSALIQFGIVILPEVDKLLEPFIKDLPKYDLSSLAATNYKGAWWLVGLFLITFVFNYFLGEEFLYRGVLLPRMTGIFGKWDWFANGVLFGFYHLHKPQVVLSTAFYFGFVFAFPSKFFQSNWMAVIIHGMEGLLGIVAVLGLVLGVT